MGEVIDRNSGLQLSISTLASEFGVSRETAAKRLAQANVEPSGTRNGYGVYRIGPASRAILGADGASASDPDKMRPTDRRAHFQALNEKLRYEAECGRLILATEVQCEMATLAKIVVRFLETLPDVVERDTRCDPSVVEYLARKARAVRTEIAGRLREEVADYNEATA
jgi:hypothetical protein